MSFRKSIASLSRRFSKQQKEYDYSNKSPEYNLSYDSVTILPITQEFITLDVLPGSTQKMPLLSVHVNELVIIKNFIGQFWAEGVNLSTGRTGYFPSICIKRIKDLTPSEDDLMDDLLTMIGVDNVNSRSWGAEDLIVPVSEEKKKNKRREMMFGSM